MVKTEGPVFKSITQCELYYTKKIAELEQENLDERDTLKRLLSPKAEVTFMKLWFEEQQENIEFKAKIAGLEKDVATAVTAYEGTRTRLKESKEIAGKRGDMVNGLMQRLGEIDTLYNNGKFDPEAMGRLLDITVFPATAAKKEG